jgi:predicted GTPase
MITFFERFSADDDMIISNECRDAFLSRLDNVERNIEIINSKVEMILSSVQSRGALERDNHWIL